METKAAEKLVERLSDEEQLEKQGSSFIGELTPEEGDPPDDQAGTVLLAEGGTVAGRRVQFNGFDLRWIEPGKGYVDGERLEIRYDDDQLYWGEVTQRMAGPLVECFDLTWPGGQVIDAEDEEEDLEDEEGEDE